MTLQFLFSVRLYIVIGAVALFVCVIMGYEHLLELVVKWTPLTLRLLVSRSALCLRANIVLLCNIDSWPFLSQLLMMEFEPCRSSGCLGPPVLAHKRCLRHLKCLTRREGLWSPLSFRALP